MDEILIRKAIAFGSEVQKKYGFVSNESIEDFVYHHLNLNESLGKVELVEDRCAHHCTRCFYKTKICPQDRKCNSTFRYERK